MIHEITGFEHLHLHSDKSLLDGFGMVQEYASRWKGFGDYLCVSDHGMMAAIPSQIKYCKSSGKKDDPYKDKSLKPIFACEMYVNPLQIQYNDEKEFKSYQKTLSPEEQKLLRRSFHLLAIAHNEVGYSNLVTLTSLAHTKGFYYRPRVNHEILKLYKEGITFTSCCYMSEIGQAFDKGGEEAGFEMIEKYMAMFGEHYYLEFMLLDFVKQKPYNQFIIKAKEKYNLPIIVTNDCHYCNQEDSLYQRLMLMVQTKNTIADIEKKIQESGSQDLFELQDTNLWMKSEEELNAKWESSYSDTIDYEIFKQAKRNTVELCRKASGVTLDRALKLPKIEYANEKLKELTIQGFKRLGLPNDKIYSARIREELELFFNKGFSSYFLILKTAIDEGRRWSMELFGHSNVIGPGRGCLSKDTKIVMADGTSRPISKIEIGDKVICRDGSLNKVRNKISYKIDEDLINITSYYGDNKGATLTKDHKVLAEKMVRPINFESLAESTQKSIKSIVEPTGQLEWIEAGNLSVGDWVFIPKPIISENDFSLFDFAELKHDKSVLTYDEEYVYQHKLNPITKKLKFVNKLPRYLNLTNDWYRLLGIFAGDGWMKSESSATEVGFAFHEDDIQGQKLVENLLTAINLKVSFVKHKTKKLVQAKVHSRHFELFIKKCFHKYEYTPHTKHIPSFVFNQNDEKKESFLRGYFGADGHNGQYKCSFSTVSNDLANQTRFMCWQLGIPASLCSVNRIDKRNGRKSVEIKINVPHNVKISEDKNGKYYFYRKLSNGIIFRIRKVSLVKEEKEVFDLEVENQHDYLTTSFQVHNSAVGSLVCYCLGITKVNPIKHDLLFSRFLNKNRNDLPDIDMDFLPGVRDYLKDDWAPKYFGAENVMSIGSYNQFGIKSSLIDMARVYGKDRGEVLALTKKLGLKDDEGAILTWDKALEMYQPLREYCENNKEVAAAAKKLLNRSRSMGKHAGGIVISSVPVNKFVPVVRGKEGGTVSAWTEGLHDQDLGPMGFVKYDWLVITNLEQINYACKIIKERHGLESICAKPGQEDFSDDSFITDEKSLAMANEGDLKGVFQFDSDGIRNLVRKGGVKSFNDLVAYSSLYRPGPMSEGMDDEYCLRNTGQKEFEIHPLLAGKGDLQKTLGIISYQEQCTKILHAVGDIPLEDCELLRKAISKKKVEDFVKYKEVFITNGVKNLDWTAEEVEKLWAQIEAFAGYAFNLSHACAYTYISFMLLWLKAHYPLEFFTAILHFEGNTDKVKEYRLDAYYHDIKINPLDLNKSKVKFDICDNEIYIGFSNIKGIGEMVAEKIVKHQPYEGFSDFLSRCGTDESVLKPLIGLRVFKDAKIDKLYTYYKWFKDKRDKREQRKRRFDDACERNIETAKSLGFEVADHKDILNLVSENKEVTDLVKKHTRSHNTYYGRSATVNDAIPGLDKFVLLPDDEQPEMDIKLLQLYHCPEECERQFYGFVWNHPICKSPDYEGKRTFDMLREKQLKVGRVEVMINSVAKTMSKKKTYYWLMKIEDANGEEVLCQVWEDDWDRFESELKVGELVKIEVKTPDQGFDRYSLNSPPKWRRDWEVPKTREADFRVFVLRKPEISD